MPLHEKLSRPARAFNEPLKPTDKAWCARNGTLRDDYGPFFPIVDRPHPDGTPAIQRQEDGSGFANYPSGRKALCTTCAQRSRRVSVIVYANREFPLVSVVPLSPAAAAAAAKSEEGAFGKKENTSWPPGVKAPSWPPPPKRTRHLGHLDDWGVGSLETVPDGAGARASYEVTPTTVTVRSGGQVTSVPRNKDDLLKANAQKLQLKLNSELTVWYDVNHGFTVIEFNCNGIQQNFFCRRGVASVSRT